MEYTVLIFSLIIINLISWIFVFRFQKKSQDDIDSIKKKCNSVDETLKKIEDENSALRKMVADNRTILFDLPVKQDYENLKVELFEKIDSLPTEIKGSIDILIEKFPKVEVRPHEIEKQTLERLTILEEKIDKLKESPTPVEKIVEPPPKQGINLNSEKDTTEIGNLFGLKEEQRISTPSPHQPLIDVLKEYDTVPSVRGVLKELETIKSDGFSKFLLRNVLDIYHKHYQSELNDLSSALEDILKSKYGVKFNHAPIGMHAVSAFGFDKIKKEEEFTLVDFEKRKVSNKRFEQEKKDVILFELCPQVKYKDETILNGKIFVS